MKKWTFLLLIISLLYMKSLFHTGFYTSHDGEHNLIRLYRYSKAIDEGQIPPRWTSNLYNGYGYPLFNFSYHLPWIIAYPIYKTSSSLTAALKSIFFLSYYLSGMTMFFYIRWKFKKNWLAFMTSLLYLIAPYRFVNIFVRATAGESMALIFPPLLFWGIDWILLEKEKLKGIFILAIGIAGLILSHGLIFILFFSFGALYFILRLITLSAKRIEVFVHFIKASFLGLSLSAFYLLPALLEKKYTAPPKASPLHDLLLKHFITLKQVLYSRWGYGFSRQGIELDDMSFQLGIGQWLVISFAALLIFKKKELSIYLALFTIAVFSMLEYSREIWQIILGYIPFDFPWRMLGFTVFISSITFAALISLIKNFFVKIIFIALVLMLIVYGNRNHLRVNKYTYLAEDYYKQKLDTTNTFNEYSPKKVREEFVKVNREIVISQNKNIVISNIEQKEHIIRFNKDGPAGKIIINQLYFPGWKLYMDGVEQEFIKNKQGVIEFKAGEGLRRIELVFKRTKVRVLSEIITITVCIIYLYLLRKAYAEAKAK